MKNRSLNLASLISVLAWCVPLGRAQDSNTVQLIERLQQRIDELEKKVRSLEQGKETTVVTNVTPQLQALDQKVQMLEHEREQAEAAAAAKLKNAPKISIGAEGFSFATADNNFAVQLRGVIEVDSRTFFNDAMSGNDGFLLRRARPILQGTVFRDFDFLFLPDFAGSSPQIYDAYLNYRYSPALQLRSGKFKSPIGLEQLQADQDLSFNERAFPTALVPNRDVGFALHGEVAGGTFNYMAGVFNGVGDGRNSSNADFNDSQAFEGRVFFLPFKQTSLKALKAFGFGVSGSFEQLQGQSSAELPATTGGTLPGYITDGQEQFFAYNPSNGVVVARGQHWRISPQGYYYCGPISLLGEYVISHQDVARTGTAPLTTASLEHSAWQICCGWVLTGEDATFKGVVPRHPFNPRQGDWGAWQLVARYSELHLDSDTFPLYSNPDSSARAAAAWSVGLDWWLNRNIRVMTSFSHTTFTGGGQGTGSTAPGAVTRNPEEVFFTRLQLAF